MSEPQPKPADQAAPAGTSPPASPPPSQGHGHGHGHAHGHGHGHGHAGGHCCCYAATPTVLQPWPIGGGFMVCCQACGLPKEDNAHHGDPKEPPPQFSSKTPTEFTERFNDVWRAVQDKSMPAGIITNCHALLLVLLQKLDPQVTQTPKTPRGFLARLFAAAPPSTPPPLERLQKLQKAGKLLVGVVEAAKTIDLDPAPKHAQPFGDAERAHKYMHLIWQIADQGFEQVRWSSDAESPPRAKAPEAHGGAHGHHS